MPTRDEYATRPIEQRLARLARTADELATAVGVVSDATLSRRPEATSWSAKEIVCHLRDIEELAMMRFRMMLAMEEPRVLVAGAPGRARRQPCRSAPARARRSSMSLC